MHRTLLEPLNHELLYWAITQTQNGKLIGTICLFDFSEELNQCEMGYELSTDYQGQGI
jgi:ribosomal-protein-alanine N-acetyltransferase